MSFERVSLSFLVILLFSATSLNATVFSTTNTVVSTAPSYVQTSFQQSFTVNVTVSNVVNLSNWQVKLWYNPHDLNYTQAFLPSINIFAGHSTLGLQLRIDSIAGSITAFDALDELYGVNGTGNLFSVTFQALAPGLSDLSFDKAITYLRDPSNALIPFQSYNGAVQANAPGFTSKVFGVTKNGVPYNITVFSNVTIANFKFNSTLQRIDFNASTPQNTVGSCIVSVPKPLMNSTFWAVLVKNNPTAHSVFGWASGASNEYISFTYQQTTTGSTHIQIITTVVGDLNGDRRVDMKDIAIMADAFGTRPGNPRWNPLADITGPTHLVPDGKVDMLDVAIVASSFGAVWRG
jgi:hypothetical protein